jgi:plastocyanin
MLASQRIAAASTPAAEPPIRSDGLCCARRDHPDLPLREYAAMQHLVGSRPAANIDLVAQLLLLLGLWGGAYLAHAHRFRAHGAVQTTLVLANLFFIFFVMISSFNTYIIAGQTTTGSVARIMLLHGALGLVAELTALYLLVRMRTKLLPPRLRVRNIKRLMRAVLLLWTVVVVVGATLYGERYLVTPAAAASAPLSQLRQSGADVYVHAVELQDAVQRHNLATAKRHAEHLVNLIEGRNGPHYGDVDGNGDIEDPGDGTGLLPELRAVTRATNDHTVMVEATAIQQEVIRIRDDALAVVAKSSVATLAPLAGEIVALARRTNGQDLFQLETQARAAGMLDVPLAVAPVAGAAGHPGMVAVVAQNFAFTPRIITVPPGTMIMWVNNDASKHTVTSDSGIFNSGDMSRGDTFAHTFTTSGRFPYYCRYHGDKGGIGMSGIVIVSASSGG